MIVALDGQQPISAGAYDAGSSWGSPLRAFHSIFHHWLPPTSDGGFLPKITCLCHRAGVDLTSRCSIQDPLALLCFAVGRWGWWSRCCQSCPGQVIKKPNHLWLCSKWRYDCCISSSWHKTRRDSESVCLPAQLAEAGQPLVTYSSSKDSWGFLVPVLFCTFLCVQRQIQPSKHQLKHFQFLLPEFAPSCLSTSSGNSNKSTSSGYNCLVWFTFHCSFASLRDGPFDTFINGFVLWGINLHLSWFQYREITAHFNVRSDPGYFPRRRWGCLVGWKAQRLMPRYSEFSISGAEIVCLLSALCSGLWV